MKTPDQLKAEIEKLEKGLKSPATPANMKPTMEKALEKAKAALAESEAKAAAKADMKKEKGAKSKQGSWVVRDREAGNIIDYFRTEKAAQDALKKYEKDDKAEGNYVEDFYEVVFLEVVAPKTKPTPAPAKKHGKFHVIEEGLESQTVADGLILKKVKDDHYDLQHKGKSAFAFEKKSGKWHVTCKVDEKNRPNGFSTLQGAVFYVAKSVYSAELKEYIESKKKAAKRAKEFRKENPTGQTSPAKDMKNAVNKVVEKLDEKKEDGESTKRDEEAIIKQIVELVKALSPEARKKLIGMLN